MLRQQTAGLLLWQEAVRINGIVHALMVLMMMTTLMQDDRYEHDIDDAADGDKY